MSCKDPESCARISIVPQVEEPGYNRNDLCYLRNMFLDEPLCTPIKYQDGDSYVNEKPKILPGIFFRIVHRILP